MRVFTAAGILYTTSSHGGSCVTWVDDDLKEVDESRYSFSAAYYDGYRNMCGQDGKVYLYPRGDYERKDNTKLQMIDMADGSAQEIDYDFTCSPTDLNTVGDNQTVTVTYKVKTATFKVNVNPVIKITTQPQNITEAVGGSATFKVVVTGKGLKYQWYFKKSGGSWKAWSGHTTATTS